MSVSMSTPSPCPPSSRPAAPLRYPPIVFRIRLPQHDGAQIEWRPPPPPPPNTGRESNPPKQTTQRDMRAPIPPQTKHITLRAPSIRFTIPVSHPYDASARIDEAIDTFCIDQRITSTQSTAIRHLAQEMKEEIREEQLRQRYYEVLMKSQPSSLVTSAPAAAAAAAGSVDESDSIDEIEREFRATSLTAVTTAPRSAILSAWLKAASPVNSVSTVSSSSSPVSSSSSSPSPPALLTLLTSLLEISFKATQALSADEAPLAKLYRFACVKHTEHLIHLQQKQAEYTLLRNKQSKEMEIICQQAQQSAIDAASMGMDAPFDPYSPSVGSDVVDASSSSSTALSEAISSLVQSHLHETRALEDSFELSHARWVRAQRRQIYTYLLNIVDDEQDRSERRLEARAIHQHARRAESQTALEKKRAKILPSDDEERELQQSTAAESDLLPIDVRAQMRVFTNHRQLERETLVECSYQVRQPTTTTTTPSSSPNEGVDDMESTSFESSNIHPPHPPSPSSIDTPPFPLENLLGSKLLWTGSSPELGKPIQLLLTNDPLFMASGEKVGAATITTNTTTTTTTTDNNSTNGAAANVTPSTITSTSSIPISSSPLISFPHFHSHLDGLAGCHGSGGVHAMVLPHHTSPLVYGFKDLAGLVDAIEASPVGIEQRSGDDGDEHTSGGGGTYDFRSIDDGELSDVASQLVRSQREKCLYQFNVANLYVKNWLQYSHHQTDLLCEDFAIQIEKITMGLKKMVEEGKKKKKSNEEDGGEDGARNSPSPSSATTSSSSSFDPSTFLSHGDVLVTHHGHALNAQLCFHVNLQPRRGASAAATVANTDYSNIDMRTNHSTGGGGVVMNEEEIKQQQFLYTSVLPDLISLTSRFNIRTLSLPLIWDNVLLSMWTISGSYVGFGWKEVDHANANANASGASTVGGTGTGVDIAAANRSEELAVYECMVRYIEAHFRAIKQCLNQLSHDSPLQSIVFYLPSAASYNNRLSHLDQPNTDVHHLIGHNIDHPHPTTSIHTANGGPLAHPFLPKCRALFREVFQ